MRITKYESVNNNRLLFAIDVRGRVINIRVLVHVSLRGYSLQKDLDDITCLYTLVYKTRLYKLDSLYLLSRSIVQELPDAVVLISYRFLLCARQFHSFIFMWHFF